LYRRWDGKGKHINVTNKKKRAPGRGPFFYQILKGIT
jgi:hypothetical protein